MDKDPEKLADTMRSFADLVETYGDDIEGVVSSVTKKDPENVELDIQEDNEKLEEVHDIEDEYLVVAEIDAEDITDVGVASIPGGVKLYTSEESIDAMLDVEVEMSGVSIMINNGVLQASLPKEK